MCGRYQFTAEDSKEIQRIVQEVQERCGRDQFTPGDVYPSNKTPVPLEDHGNYCIGAFRRPEEKPSKV